MTKSNQIADDHDVETVQRAVFRPRLEQNVWRVNVVLVEDDPADCELIVRALKKNDDVGFVKAYESPETALEALRDEQLRPTVILADVHMPRMDGFQFVDLVRRIPHVQEVPVVFLTTSSLERDVEEARQSTACKYIVKPASYGDLQDRLNDVVKQMVAGTRRK